jgi:hypothetical protein
MKMSSVIACSESSATEKNCGSSGQQGVKAVHDIASTTNSANISAGLSMLLQVPVDV